MFERGLLRFELLLSMLSLKRTIALAGIIVIVHTISIRALRKESDMSRLSLVLA